MTISLACSMISQSRPAAFVSRLHHRLLEEETVSATLMASRFAPIISTPHLQEHLNRKGDARLSAVC